MPRREPSLRARARDILKRGSARAQRESAALPPGESRAPAQGAAVRFAIVALPQAETSAPSLTERVRDLFENSVLPVREIARLAGVTERTIYKYAAKHRWRPRYRWNEGKAGARHRSSRTHDPANAEPVCREDNAPAQESKASGRHRGWSAPAAFAPAKGAGGRFVARERAGEAHPVGLKATDPAGAARAAAACVRAGEVAAAARLEAERVQRAEACIAAIGQVHAALARLNAHGRKRCLENQRKQRSKAARERRSPEAEETGEAEISDRLSLPLFVGANFALLVWERALRETAEADTAHPSSSWPE